MQTKTKASASPEEGCSNSSGHENRTSSFSVAIVQYKRNQEPAELTALLEHRADHNDTSLGLIHHSTDHNNTSPPITAEYDNSTDYDDNDANDNEDLTLSDSGFEVVGVMSESGLANSTRQDGVGETKESTGDGLTHEHSSHTESRVAAMETGNPTDHRAGSVLNSSHVAGSVFNNSNAGNLPEVNVIGSILINSFVEGSMSTCIGRDLPEANVLSSVQNSSQVAGNVSTDLNAGDLPQVNGSSSVQNSKLGEGSISLEANVTGSDLNSSLAAKNTNCGGELSEVSVTGSIQNSLDVGSTISSVGSSSEVSRCELCHETFPVPDLLVTHTHHVHTDRMTHHCGICKARCV